MNLSNIIKKIFSPAYYWLLVAIAIIEISSYAGFVFPSIRGIAFGVLIIITLILSLKNIRYGIAIALLELLIGSKGYLLHLDVGGERLSLRIAIWIVVMAVWIKYFLSSLKKGDEAQKSIFLKKEIFNRAYLNLFFILFAFIAWGAINGFWHRDFSNAFLDFNGYLYFALLFPFYESIFNKKFHFQGENNPFWLIWTICAAGISWLIIKTYLLLFFFSHTISNPGALYDFLIHQIYYWIRGTGIGEITNMPSGFVRVFFQSHIYILASFYALLLAAGRFWGEIIKNKKLSAFIIFSLSLTSSLILMSFSRSFWVAIIATLPIYAIIAWKRFGSKRLIASFCLIIISLILGLAMITATVKFPYPKPGINFDVSDAFASRALKISNEPAVSSRYALLPKLWEGIKENILFGAGFGQTITYKTSDPKIIQNNQEGVYTTYAFEWGWLDICLKIGVFGALAYLLLIGKIIKDAFQKETLPSDLFAIILCVLTIVSFFTPYTNHPLGIGLLILAAAVISWEKKPCPCAQQ